VAAAALVGPPISDAPNRDTLSRQFWPEMTKLLSSCSWNVFPAAAVDQNRDRMRPWTVRKEDVNHLRRVRAVKDLQRGRRARQSNEGREFDRVACAHGAGHKKCKEQVQIASQYRIFLD